MAYFSRVKESLNLTMTAPYLVLTDAEWKLIQPILPVPKRGPRRPNDRTTCAAFLFAKAVNVSLESLPIGCYPSPDMLRTTAARWGRDGTFDRLLRIGATVTERMQRQFREHLIELSADPKRCRVTGEATETMPRWTHIQRRVAAVRWARRS
jgi:transposase